MVEMTGVSRLLFLSQVRHKLQRSLLESKRQFDGVLPKLDHTRLAQSSPSAQALGLSNEGD